jgi:hypothetical protein
VSAGELYMWCVKRIKLESLVNVPVNDRTRVGVQTWRFTLS